MQVPCEATIAISQKKKKKATATCPSKLHQFHRIFSSKVRKVFFEENNKRRGSFIMWKLPLWEEQTHPLNVVSPMQSRSQVAQHWNHNLQTHQRKKRAAGHSDGAEDTFWRGWLAEGQGLTKSKLCGRDREEQELAPRPSRRLSPWLPFSSRLGLCHSSSSVCRTSSHSSLCLVYAGHLPPFSPSFP